MRRVAVGVQACERLLADHGLRAFRRTFSECLESEALGPVPESALACRFSGCYPTLLNCIEDPAKALQQAATDQGGERQLRHHAQAALDVLFADTVLNRDVVADVLVGVLTGSGFARFHTETGDTTGQTTTYGSARYHTGRASHGETCDTAADSASDAGDRGASDGRSRLTQRSLSVVNSVAESLNVSRRAYARSELLRLLIEAQGMAAKAFLALGVTFFPCVVSRTVQLPRLHRDRGLLQAPLEIHSGIK